jgi:SAM-dependent methyltransferase
MNSQVFRRKYADQYDLLYSDKDYEAECDLLEEVFRRYGDGDIHTILDLGCGTGGHAIPLARRSYQVTGVDSSPDMLKCAQENAATNLASAISHPPAFLQGDVRSIALGQKFDSVLMMFAVLGYQTTNEDVLATLSTVSRHLKPGGLFICDVWYGPAVLMQRPTEKVKIIPTPKGKIIRTASGHLDTFRHLCEIRYHIFRIEDQRVVSESEEKHTMRYFFPQEMAILMHHADLKMADIFDFGKLELQPAEDTWNVLVIAKKESI